MSVHDLAISNLMSRVGKLESNEIEERLGYIEKHLKHFVFATTEIVRLFNEGIKLNVEEKAQLFLDELKYASEKLKQEVRYVEQLTLELKKQSKDESIPGTIKFMAKELHELKQHIHAIKEEGIKKDLHLAFTVDGYEMVKRKPPNTNPEIQEKHDPEEEVKLLLSTLSNREGQVLIHFFGLLGHSKKSVKDMERIIGVGRERISQIKRVVLRKLRHPSRKHLVDNITHIEFKKAILEG